MRQLVCFRVRQAAYPVTVVIDNTVVSDWETFTLTFFMKIEHKVNKRTAKRGEHDSCEVKVKFSSTHGVSSW